MKLKKLISVILIISMLFTTLCPISLAKYVYGPESSSYPIDWKNLSGGLQVQYNPSDYITGINQYAPELNTFVKLETIEVGVNKSGIYNVSNSMEGNVSAQYVICTKAADGTLVPLPVSLYSADGETASDVSKYNSANAKTASVYLEEGQTYYYVMVGENGDSLHQSSPSEGTQINVNLEYIEPKEGETAYETEVSSMNYTAPNGIDGNAWFTDYGTLKKNEVANNDSLESISSDNISSDLNNAAEYDGMEQNASWFEQVITWFLLLVADGLRAAISLAIGEDISIDELLFNEYPGIRLSLFSSSTTGGNNYLDGSGMLGNEGVINKYFMLFRNIAIAVYIVMLLYMGVRVLLASTGKNKERYKSMMGDWIKGIVILAFFPYVMKYSIAVNDAIVQYISDLRPNLPSNIELPTLSGVSDEEADVMNLVNSDISANGDIMETMRVTAAKTGRVAYAIIYTFLIKQLLSFVYIYFKRLISVIFLIIIFPLVTISYAVDKIGDGKSQAFNHWYKEFTLNVFMQSFQAINYIVVMSVIFALAEGSAKVNFILVLVGLQYIEKGDELLRGLFSKMSGGGANTIPKSLSEAAKTVAKVKMAKDVADKIGGVGRGVAGIKSRYDNTVDAYYKYQKRKHLEFEAGQKAAEEWRKNSITNSEKHAIDNVADNINIAFNASGTHTGVEVKQALDRIQTALNDPARRQKVLDEYAKLATRNADGTLNTADQEKLDKLLEANEAINASRNRNVGTKGRLTNKEINVNAKIIFDIDTEKNTGMYKDLYDYMTSQTMTDATGAPILNASGAAVTLMDTLKKQSERRTINGPEQTKMQNAQAWIGDVTGIDTSVHGTNGVDRSKRRKIATKERDAAELASENAFARSKQARFGNASATGAAAKAQEEAADLAAKFQSYAINLKNGTSSGYSITEITEMTMKLRELSESTDADVQNIIKNGCTKVDSNGNVVHDKNGNTIDISIEEMIGCDLETLEASVSVEVLTNKSSLEGSEEDKQRMIDYAGKRVVEIAAGSQFITDSDGKLKEVRHQSSKAARTIIERAEIDDYTHSYINKYKKAIEDKGSESDIEYTDYVRPRSQEKIRDDRELERKRKAAEEEYNKYKQSLAEARTEIYRSAFGRNKK